MTANTLKDHFIIAMPGMTDPRFSQSVTYICEHNKGGAMGIVINQPATMTYAELFRQLEMNDSFEDTSPLIAGGPVQKERGFVLHSNEKRWTSTLAVSNDILITSSKDILEDMANYEGPKHSLLALGYAGWEAGQLENEILQNSWLTVPASPHIVFETPLEDRWLEAAKIIGVNMHLMSSHMGHA